MSINFFLHLGLGYLSLTMPSLEKFKSHFVIEKYKDNIFKFLNKNANYLFSSLLKIKHN